MRGSLARLSLRRARGPDPLGLRRTLADRLLPPIAAAMAFLAALAVLAAAGAGGLGARWSSAAAATVLLPAEFAPARRVALLTALRGWPDVAAAAEVDPTRLAALLRPWLGATPPPALPLPTVIELRLAAGADAEALGRRLAAAAPEAALEVPEGWIVRVLALARSLQTVAWAALLLVAAVSCAVVAVSVRAGVAATGDTMALLHELGAADGDLAARFARRAGLLVAAGAAAGIPLGVPVALWLGALAAPLAGAAAPPTTAAALAALPWGGLLAVPLAGGLLGWATAAVTVRLWLRTLP